jgi:hypothetical protein
MQAGLIVSIVLTVVAFVALWAVGLLACFGYLGPGAKPFPNPLLRIKTPFNESTTMESGVEMPQMPPKVVDGPCGEDVYNASPPLKPRKKLRQMVPPSVMNWAKKPAALVRGERVEMPRMPAIPDEEDVVATNWFDKPQLDENVHMPTMPPVSEDVYTSSRGQDSVTRKEVPKGSSSRGGSKVKMTRIPSPMGPGDEVDEGHANEVSDASSDAAREPLSPARPQ